MKIRKSLNRYDKFSSKFYQKVQRGFLKLAYMNKKKYKIINQVYIFNKKDSFLKKINILQKIVRNDYYGSFAVDGKSFSYLCNFLIKAKASGSRSLDIFWSSEISTSQVK